MKSLEHEFQTVDVPDEWNVITSKIIGTAMEVHTRLGPVGLENVFERAMVVEMRHLGLDVRGQTPVRLNCRGEVIGEFVLDLLVQDFVVVELKAIDQIADVHFAQLASQLRHGGFPLGLLINFRVSHLRDGIHRRINPKSSRFVRANSTTPKNPTLLSASSD